MKRKWSKQQEKLIKRHIDERQSMPSEMILKIIEWDPEFFEHYLNFSAHPWKKGVLPPKVKELIYIAIDAATTHLWEPGLVDATLARAAREGGNVPPEIEEAMKRDRDAAEAELDAQDKEDSDDAE